MVVTVHRAARNGLFIALFSHMQGFDTHTQRSKLTTFVQTMISAVVYYRVVAQTQKNFSKIETIFLFDTDIQMKGGGVVE